MLLFKMKYKKWQTPEMMSAIFILHREIVLTMKASFTLRAYLMSEDTSIAR